jgi:hypothetical protein
LRLDTDLGLIRLDFKQYVAGGKRIAFDSLSEFSESPPVIETVELTLFKFPARNVALGHSR